MLKRDEILKNYAKASGIFEYAANAYKRDRSEEKLSEAKRLIDNLVNTEFSKVRDYCNQHKNDKDMGSLLAIASADCAAMQELFNSL